MPRYDGSAKDPYVDEETGILKKLAWLPDRRGDFPKRKGVILSSTDRALAASGRADFRPRSSAGDT